MKKITLFIVALATVSCGNSVSDADLPKLSGYWEIETAVLPDGTEKEYTINATIDFIELKGNEGIRRKVMPQLDGKYIVNDLKENILIVEKEGDFFIKYNTPYAKWSEQIITLSDKELVLKNEQKIEYHYKKPIPFSVK